VIGSHTVDRVRSIPLIVAVLLAGCAQEERPLWSRPLEKRSEMPIPGLRGKVSIGDMRNGATATLHVSNQFGQTLAQKVAMSRGESIRFEHGLEHYEVTLLRNDDGAVTDQAHLQFRTSPGKVQPRARDVLN
jgi:hypothetical protein